MIFKIFEDQDWTRTEKFHRPLISAKQNAKHCSWTQYRMWNTGLEPNTECEALLLDPTYRSKVNCSTTRNAQTQTWFLFRAKPLCSVVNLLLRPDLDSQFWCSFPKQRLPVFKNLICVTRERTPVAPAKRVSRQAEVFSLSFDRTQNEIVHSFFSTWSNIETNQYS